MKTYLIQQDKDKILRFKGVFIGNVSSHRYNAKRWTELNLYKTEQGRYIGQTIGRTQIKSERDIYNAKVCKSENEVIEFFGLGKLARRLYDMVNIQPIIDDDNNMQSIQDVD